jgi:CO/xanthine dehydrogenase FAD-binding subunit
VTYSVIGRSVRRTDAESKARGRAIYGMDLTMPNVLEGRFLRAGIPHARILRINTSQALKVPGVREIVTGSDWPRNHGPLVKDQPSMAIDKVQHAGEVVAAVSAVNDEAAAEELDRIIVDYDPLPILCGIDDALAPGAGLLHEGYDNYERVDVSGIRLRGVPNTNIPYHFQLRKGDLERGFHEADESQIPLLAAACGKVASTVIRSMGTIGGNVCYAEPASDPPAALLALDATVVLKGRIGRRRVPVRAFFVDTSQTACAADEVLVEIVVPITRVGTEYRYLKWSPRAKEDKPLIGLAVLLRRDGDRCEDLQLGLSGVCPAPVLLRAPFAVLGEQELTPDSIAGAAHAAPVDVEPFDDNQASAEYRRAMVELWFNRVVWEFVKVTK